MLDMVREKVQMAANGDLESLSSDDANGEKDPMDLVETENIPSPKKPKTKPRGDGETSRTRYYLNAAKSSIFYVDMPEKPREEDPNGTEKRKIALYIVDRITILA